MKIKNLTITEQQEALIKAEALKAIAALNHLILAGVYHKNITEADFLLNTWFDANFDESER
jgi:hypothetical protein